MDTHMDNSIGNVDQLLHVASTLSLPKITSSSVDNLVQYSTIPESAIVENTVPPVISPYNLYRKRGSLPQGIRALIASKKRMNQKEQVHSSKMDHCSLPASTKEQYVTLSIPPDYISGWKTEARIALLDTRFLEYEHAVISTVLTTLNAGSIVSDYESDEDDDLSYCNDSDDDYDELDPDERQAFRKPQSCMMLQYDTDFPPMERYVDSAQKYSCKPYVQNNVVDTEGKLKPLTQAEEVLNRQTTNARAQNRSLTTLDTKMDRVLARVQRTESKVEGMENQLQKIYDNLVQKIQQLDRDLRFLIDQRDFGLEFNQKEAEIRRLKRNLQIEQDRYKVTKPLPVYSPFTSQPLFTTQPLFGESPPPSPPDYSKYSLWLWIFLLTFLKLHQSTHNLSTLIKRRMKDTECASLEDSDMISEGSKDSEANLADITSILMADAESSRQPQEQVAENIEGDESDSDQETAEPTVLQPDISNTKPVAGPWFTFDDVPIIKMKRKAPHLFSID
ncbi:polyprotein [Sesamum angolense]|uniref:Polyprotein n=1 Tax=Sesamum angolense TaxID=2727404 RepID=A0AAE1VZ37_9LAMI|nr:polyprotein [Sesamum angolense]